MATIDDMMSHLDEAKESNDEQVSADSSCANCAKEPDERLSIRKVVQSDESSGANSASRQTWTNEVCPNCGKVYERKRSHS